MVCRCGLRHHQCHQPAYPPARGLFNEFEELSRWCAWRVSHVSLEEQFDRLAAEASGLPDRGELYTDKFPEKQACVERPTRRPRAMLGITRRRWRCSVRKRSEREEPWLTSQFQHRTQLQCRSWLLFRKLHLCLACPCSCACVEQAVGVGAIQTFLDTHPWYFGWSSQKKKNIQHSN